MLDWEFAHWGGPARGMLAVVHGALLALRQTLRSSAGGSGSGGLSSAGYITSTCVRFDEAWWPMGNHGGGEGAVIAVLQGARFRRGNRGFDRVALTCLMAPRDGIDGRRASRARQDGRCQRWPVKRIAVETLTIELAIEKLARPPGEPAARRSAYRAAMMRALWEIARGRSDRRRERAMGCSIRL